MNLRKCRGRPPKHFEVIEGTSMAIDTLLQQIGDIAIRQRWIGNSAPQVREFAEYSQDKLGEMTDILLRIKTDLQGTVKQ